MCVRGTHLECGHCIIMHPTKEQEKYRRLRMMAHIRWVACIFLAVDHVNGWYHCHFWIYKITGALRFWPSHGPCYARLIVTLHIFQLLVMNFNRFCLSFSAETNDPLMRNSFLCRKICLSSPQFQTGRFSACFCRNDLGSQQHRWYSESTAHTIADPRCGPPSGIYKYKHWIGHILWI